IVEVPATRWDVGEHAALGGGRWGGSLEEIDRFDHALFQIAHLEATSMDPAERLFLEIAWETLEHAGYPRARRAAAQRRTGLGTGVFVGCMYRQYAHLARDPRTRGLLSNGSYWSIANRASWFFDLQGPSLALDNACAAGLTSVHQACRALLDGECAMALAGAVNLSLHPHKYTGLALAGLMSASPTPRLFGEGDGFVPGEGVAAVLLKPLARAQADGDRILAVIRASRVNHGGRTPGFSVPGMRAQAELIASTLGHAGLSPRSVDYLELAANGSAIGDTVELRALTRAFGGAPQGSIPVGSTKAALGHLEAASGLAQLVKVVLQMQHRELFPSLPTAYAEAPRLPEGSPFRLLPTTVAWEPRPARAGIHAFGAGGSNAFLLLESYDPLVDAPSPAAGPHLFLFSAATAERLRAWVSRVDDHLARHAPAAADLSYTLQVARERLPHRLAVVADGLPALRELFSLWLSGGVDPRIAAGEAGADDPLLDGPEGEAFLRIVVAHRRLDKLARLWVRGIDAEWAALYPGGRPALVDLPPYPFARTVCWLPEAPLPAAGEARAPAATATLPVRDAVRHLLAGLLKLDPEQIDPRRDLRDYGVDSMLGTLFLLGIRERLGIELPLHALRDATSLETLSRQLEAATEGDEHRAGEDPPLPAELLRFQRGGREPPSFWVHGAPGFAQVFTRMPDVLGPERPIYAFQARGLDGARPPFIDMSEMARYYVDALQRARPEGPYLLGGYSLGGLIALEMARLLTGRGAPVAAVVMFDTYPAGPKINKDIDLPDHIWKHM
ncbi:MAG: alpha/beta fold hydrolase, partial [Byssovorax sp.]